MLVFLLVLAVGWLAVLYASKCRELSEARIQLDERTRQLEEMHSSLMHTRGKAARRMAKRSQPFRDILRKVPGLNAQSRTS